MNEEQTYERLLKALQDGVVHIDANILSCRLFVDQYHQRKSDLAAVNERLSKLGFGLN